MIFSNLTYGCMLQTSNTLHLRKSYFEIFNVSSVRFERLTMVVTDLRPRKSTVRIPLYDFQMTQEYMKSTFVSLTEFEKIG